MPGPDGEFDATFGTIFGQAGPALWPDCDPRSASQSPVFSMLRVFIVCFVSLIGSARLVSADANSDSQLPLALRGANLDWVSSGVYRALVSEGLTGESAAQAESLPVGSPGKGEPAARLDVWVAPNRLLALEPDGLPVSGRQQAEPHVVRSPADANTLLATFQEGRFSDGGAVSCGYAISRDGGMTWQRALIPNLTSAAGGTYVRASDPVAAIGRDGTMYLNNLSARTTNFSLVDLTVSRSTDGGATWSQPLVAFSPPDAQTFPDKNWVAINQHPGTATSNRLVVTYTAFTSNAAGQATGNNVGLVFSDDRGESWTGPFLATPTGDQNQGTQPVFLPDGSLLLAYITFTTSSSFRVEAKRSADGGRTWPANAVQIANVPAAWDDPIVRDGATLISAAGAAESGAAFVTWNSNVGGQATIMVSGSTNNGASWFQPVRVNDTPVGVSAFNPTVAVSADGQVVTVSWMDKRNAAGDAGLVDMFAATSEDGGQTWSASFRLSDRTTDVRLSQSTSRGFMIGDYFGLAAAPTPDIPTVAVWVDTRDGEADPVSVRFDPRPVRDFEHWQNAHFAGAGIALAAQQDFGADPDGDGFANGYEFNYGFDPHTFDGGSAHGLDATDELVIVTEPVLPGGGPRAVPHGRWQYSIDGDMWLNATTHPSVDTINGATALVRPPGETLFFRRQIQDGSGGFLTAPEVLVHGGDARLINLSTRGFAGTGTAQLQPGFVTAGEDLSVLLRVSGPALTALGVDDVLADPRFRLSPATADPAPVYDDWGEEPTVSAAVFAAAGAFAFADGSADAAVVTTLLPPATTLVVDGADGGTGVALAELFDLSSGDAGGRLVNLSTRGRVGGEAATMIGGFVLAGSTPRRCLIRAIGPQLTEFDVTGEVSDPRLELYRGGESHVIASNDDWVVSPSAGAIREAMARVGAFPLDENSRDAVVLTTLTPGAYTAVMSGVGDAVGIGLLEIYLVE